MSIGTQYHVENTHFDVHVDRCVRGPRLSALFPRVVRDGFDRYSTARTRKSLPKMEIFAFSTVQFYLRLCDGWPQTT